MIFRLHEWLWARTNFFAWLPAPFVYFCAFRVWVDAGTPPYTDGMFQQTMDEAIARFARRHAIPGSGKDEHFDSNRNVGGTRA